MRSTTTLKVKYSELPVEGYFDKASRVPVRANLHLYSDSRRGKRTALEDVQCMMAAQMPCLDVTDEE